MKPKLTRHTCSISNQGYYPDAKGNQALGSNSQITQSLPQATDPPKKRARRSRRGGVRNARRRENRERRDRDLAIAEISNQRGLDETWHHLTKPVERGVSATVPTCLREMRKNDMSCECRPVEHVFSTQKDLRNAAAGGHQEKITSSSGPQTRSDRQSVGRDPVSVISEHSTQISYLESKPRAQHSLPKSSDELGWLGEVQPSSVAEREFHVDQGCLELSRNARSRESSLVESLWHEWCTIMRRSSVTSDDFDLFQRRRSRLCEGGPLKIEITAR